MEAGVGAPESCARGEASGIGEVTVLEADAPCSEGINVGTGLVMVAVASQVIGTQAIDVKSI
jgi:hypothetical protein